MQDSYLFPCIPPMSPCPELPDDADCLPGLDIPPAPEALLDVAMLPDIPAADRLPVSEVAPMADKPLCPPCIPDFPAMLDMPG